MRSEPRLFHYIRQYRDNNHSFKQIEGYLARRGYSHRDIKEAIIDFNQAKDLDNEDTLVKYFDQHLDKGYTLPSLIEHALKNNIDRHLVERAVLRTKTPHEKKVKSEKKEIQVEEPDAKDYRKPDPISWRDAVLIIILFTCLGLTFISHIFIFASLLMFTIFIWRLVGTSKKKLVTISVAGFVLFLIVAPFVMPMLSLIAAGMFLVLTVIFLVG
jgi:hypothetical protein